MKDETLDQINAKLNTIIALIANAMNSSENGHKRTPEEILTGCGMKSNEVGVIFGKNAAAIRKAVQRTRTKLRKK